MKNLLSVDLEDWFSVEAFNNVIDKKEWQKLDSVVERTTADILALFSQYKVRATFFVLGWVANKYPELVARVAESGHEISCHSFYHRMVSSITPDEFKRDTEMAIDAIIKATGITPRGYRSPSWGMKREMTWAYEIMADFGFTYDSSIFPIYHDIYGDPGAPTSAYCVSLPQGRQIVEIPASTIPMFGKRFPIGGGGWLRQFPYWFTRRGIRRLNENGIPAMIYFHPWELDPNIPRMKLSMKNSIRQYGNLGTMRIKVERLLTDFDFSTISEYITAFSGKEGVHTQ